MTLIFIVLVETGAGSSPRFALAYAGLADAYSL